MIDKYAYRENSYRAAAQEKSAGGTSEKSAGGTSENRETKEHARPQRNRGINQRNGTNGDRNRRKLLITISEFIFIKERFWLHVRVQANKNLIQHASKVVLGIPRGQTLG
jgi:hypothetical protein